jgi:uncharacterized protein (TIGR03663 family)
MTRMPSEGQQVKQAGPHAKFTVEAALYGAVFALGLGLRLLAQGRWPLQYEEAGLALDAWRFARALPSTLRGHSPLLFHVNALLLFLTDGSDELARLCCVLFGSCMVLLPYGLRRCVGRIGALAISLLIAISPSLVYFSRSVDGSIIVAFCALALLVTLADALPSPGSLHLVSASGLLTVALLSGPSAYTLLAVLLTFPVFVALYARFRDRAPLEELRGAWQAVRADSRAWLRALGLSLGLFLAVGVAFTFNMAGLQMALDQLGQWMGAFQFLGGSPWYLIALLLSVYAALPLIFGLTGLLVMRGRGDVWSMLLRYWFVFTLLFSVVPGYRPPGGMLLALLPLLVAAGWALDRLGNKLLEVVHSPWLWALVATSLIVFAAAYIQLMQYLSFPQSTHLLRLAALTVFLGSSYALVWSLSGAQVPLRAAGLSLLLLMLLAGIRTEVRLNYAQARSAGEPIVDVATSPEVLDLAREASRLSSQLEGDERVMTLLLSERLEVPLGWYLRSFAQMSYTRSMPAEPEADGLITSDDVAGPTGYVGLRFGLRSANTTLSRSPLEWLRWWTGYKPMSAGTQTERVVLWVRQPLP